ncbi:ubiquitin carboxyl-terminal hydrolase [Musa troglodytarum]|uniref:ubiquitinyl hydrolase 1 n=1 Tax=Musa troglodytarum TaxID=320322 RepID=A0A9E7GC64_9LILI|nr:ubiquitin carboxyl-terminal hydrolase [Musa troglodytarum]
MFVPISSTEVSSSPPPSPLRLLFFLSCWSGSDRRPRRRSGGISEEDEKGLKNLGNSCYLNSVLHCLTDTPALAQFYLYSWHPSLCKPQVIVRESREECPFCILERQIARSLSLDGPLDAPSKIHKCLADVAEHFPWRRQEDAHEFLRYLIDSCQNACLKIHKRSISGGNPKAEERSCSGTVMKETFGGGPCSAR